MSGRTQHEKHLENQIMEGLEGFPEVIINFADEAAGAQQTTKKTTVNIVKRFVIYLKEQGINIDDPACWSKITKRNIKDYFKSIKRKSNGEWVNSRTLSNYLTAIQTFFNYLYLEEYIDKNPCPTRKEMDGIFSKEMREHHVVYLTPEEVKHVESTILRMSPNPKRDACIFMLGCRTGLRVQALVDIDIKDIDFEAKTIDVIEKNKSIRTVYLDDNSVQMIKDCIAERNKEPLLAKTDMLFCKLFKGMPRRLTADYVEDMIRRYTRDLDKYITPHKLRATCITNTYKATGDIYAAARRAGHASLTNTKLYIDTTDEDKKIADTIASLY